MKNTRTVEGWVKKSFRLSGRSNYPTIVYNFQSIGKMDCRLSHEWKQMKDGLTKTDNIMKFDDHSFQSSLWVMAAYELVRIIKSIDKGPDTKTVYEMFRRVRVPMVKFDAPRTKGKPDYKDDFGIAYAALGRETNDLGWAISPQTFVSRNDLADALYCLFN